MSLISVQELHSKYNICLGITLWKRANFLHYVGGPENAHFVALKDFHDAVVEAVEKNARIVCWSSSVPTGLAELVEKSGVEMFLVEDGFIRSSGLGIKLNMPASLCFSRLGIHYDARTPSSLEQFLQNHLFAEQEAAIGYELIELLRRKRITKYNLKADKAPVSWPEGDGKKILAIGQVGDDASLRFGSLVAGSNYELLHSVRAHSPKGRILYRPHPDVTSGLRIGSVNEEDLLEVGAISSTDGDLIDLILSADEVHVASSQTGLEACVHGAKVVCHGQPFFSGWGLTEDVHGIPGNRRGRQLSLGEFIYGAYVAYPCYIDPYTGRANSVFETIDLIESGEKWPQAPRSYIIAVWFRRRGVNLAIAKKPIKAFRKISRKIMKAGRGIKRLFA